MEFQQSVRLAILCGCIATASSADAQITFRPTFGYDGSPPMDSGAAPFFARGGRYVAFSSKSDNLVPGDTNMRADCFVLDQFTHRVERVNLAWDGRQSNNHCGAIRLSEDARFVAFYTWSTNMVADDTNGSPDIFVRDLFTGDVTRVSVSSDGEQGNNGAADLDITPDARFVSFASHATNMVDDDTNDQIDVFVHDRSTGITERVSIGEDGQQGDRSSGNHAISADGRFVAFMSYAWNLVEGDTNLRPDIFVRDRHLGTTTIVSVSSTGEYGNAGSGYNGVVITPDGRYVAFGSDANNLVPNDTNNQHDVFLHDRWTGRTSRVSVRTGGGQAHGDMPAVSADARFIAFFALDPLVAEDTNGVGDVYLHDRVTNTTRLVSRATEGSVGDKVSAWPAISADGRFVGFVSDATNLAPNDNNGQRDVFVHLWQPGSGVTGGQRDTPQPQPPERPRP